MTSYIVTRLIQALIVLMLVTMILFGAMRLLPGDPLLLYISQDLPKKSSEAQLEALRKEFGLDKPIVVQYINWVSGVFRGDLGQSIQTRRSVSGDIARRLPITFHLGIIAFILSIIVGIPAGVISAVKRGKWMDTAVTTLANFGVTVPVFWLGILLIYLFGLYLRWLPIQGYTSPFTDFGLNIRQIIMPIFCLSIFGIASATRLTRSSMLEIIRQDYIRTAWSKGLNQRSVIFRHALKNSLIPVATIMGMTIRNIFGGSVLIETVFNIPGMGRMMVDGLRLHDYTVVQGVTLVMAVVVLLGNLIVDLSYGWLDPRIRFD